MPTSTKNPPTINVDGNLSEWTTDQLIDNPSNATPGYHLYGTVGNDFYYIAIQAIVGTDPIIGSGTTIWLNTDQNNTTGYTPFASIGADYNITYVGGSFYLYTGAAGENLVSFTPLTAALSPDGESLEIAIPRSLLTPVGGPAPTNINIAAQIDTGTPQATFLPPDYTLPEYTITDPATLVPTTPTHKVAIVYSDTSAALYFSQTAYSDLFMAAQNQARMAGVSYDVIDESQLTSVDNLIGYDALIFPSMANVNTAQLPAIMSALTSAVYNYGVSIITSGDFLTNDQTGTALPGNSYSNMEALLGLARSTGGNSGNVTVTAADVGNPIMRSYTAGQTIQIYTNEGYAAYQGVNTPTDVLVDQNVQDVGTLPGVIQTKTGGTNVHFATTALLGDSNLLSNAIQSVVLGTQPGVALHMSRDAGVVAVRMDMDQSQFPADVSPAGGGSGIYDTLIPILQQWNQQYNFVGTFLVNIGDNPNGEEPSTTDWSKSLAYYQAIEAMGSEIGNHSFTHLINPPTITFAATTVGDTPAGSTQITLGSVPSFAGVTVGMVVTGVNIGSNTPLPGAAGEGGSIANTQVTAVSGNTITISYIPGGFGTANDGTLGDIPAGTTLTFSIPAENTNFLQTGTGAVTSGDGQPFTYDYEFNQSKSTLQTQLGTTIYGAAIPGSNETYATDQNILQYYQSVVPSGTTAGYTGYLTGGWTGVGSGYPSAFGYMSSSTLDQNSVYLAPNMTFDFTEIQYEGKTIQQAEADWAAQFSSLSAHAAGTPIIELPIHDYGAAAWNTTTDTGVGSPYSTQMYRDFLSMADANNYEFVTLEDLASRIVAQEKASINYTTSGNAITATVTPDPSAPDLGAMALDVIDGGTEVIQNVTGWYAYNATELFLPRNGGTFTVNLGNTQDAVTHITSLPMRDDLLSVNGDGTNLSFSIVGSGSVVIELKQSATPIVTGAAIAGLTGNLLTLALTGLGQHDVTVTLPAIPTEVVSSAAFSADSGASATDFITNVASQTIAGTLSAPLAAGDVVMLSLDNGTTWLTASAAPGATTFSLAGATLTGSSTLIAEVKNTSGLASAPLTQAYVLDQVPPTETAVIVSMTNDSGTAGDFITSDGVAGRMVAGTLSAALATDEVLQVSSDGGATWVAATVAGTNWSVTDSASHAASWTIEAEVVDLAGNLGSLASQAVTFDNTPPAAPGTPDLDAVSDNGASSTDNITSITTPSFSGTAEPGSVVTLLDSTTPVGTAVAAADGSWSITTTVLSVAVHAISATATDVAGNVSAASAALSVTIEAPPPAPSVPDLIAASDSGASSTDNITNSVSPAFQGTATPGIAVNLFDGTTLIGSGVATTLGAWTIASSTILSDGVHNITAVAADAAGIVSAPSAALVVTIDTVPPTEKATIVSMTNDSGTPGDFITNDGAAGRTVSGTLSAALAADESLLVSSDGGATWAAATVTGTNWSAIDSASHAASWTIEAEVVDLAGNPGALAGQAVTFGNTPPPPPSTPDLTAASDNGASSTDNITSITTPTFVGTAASGDTVTLLDGTTHVGTAVAATDGTWSITTTVLSVAVHAISATATDVTGNVSAASAALSVTIKAPPAAPSTPDLIAASDSGRSSTDNITNLTTPTFRGTATPGIAVSLFDGTTLIGSGITTNLGVWTIASSTPLSDAVHNITAVAKDSAGIASAPSAALAVTIDTVIAPPSTPDMTAATDNGLSNTDNITNDSTPTFTGTTEASAQVTLFDGTTIIGTGRATTAGVYTITSSALSVGAHNISARAVDVAGNVSLLSGSLSVIIDTSAPTVPSVPDLLAASDSGVSNTDNITNVTTPTFTGTADPGTTVSIFSGTTKVGTGLVAADGTWSITTSALANGVRSISAKATDVAGNVSVASGVLSVTVDTTTATPSRPALTAASDTGVSATDNITKINTPTFTGTAEANSTVTLFDGTAAIGTGVATGGTWTITTSTLADGTHTISAKSVDLAGNFSAVSNTRSVTVDTAAPTAPTFTNGSTTSLNGKGEPGAIVSVSDGTSIIGSASVGTGGNWSMSFIAGSSVRTLTAVQSDKAGNVSPTSGLALLGTSGADTLSGTSGADLFIGGSGADKFSLTALFGNDIIVDFATGGAAHDIINISGSSVLNSFANVLSHTTQVGTSSVIRLDANDAVTLLNVSKASLTASDFTFV